MAIVEYLPWAIMPHIDGHADFNVVKWDGVTHVILQDWKLHYIGDCGEFKLLVKPGFAMDGGSVPELFWNIISPWGANTIAFITHDAFYASELVDRKIADWILLELMQCAGTSWAIRNAAWRSVRDFGDSVWEKHTSESISKTREFIRLEIIKTLSIPKGPTSPLET
jgi:hypothetical protein